MKTLNSVKQKNPEDKIPEKRNEKGILSVLIHELRNDFNLNLEEIKITDVRIGLGYTGVLLSTGYGGVACTPLYDISCCSTSYFPETLRNQTADYILGLTLSDNHIEVAVGIATLNAFFHMLHGLKLIIVPTSDTDILDLIKPEDRIAMVGYFGPLVPKILKITERLKVLEKRKIEASTPKILPSEKAGEILPASDVIILSASTLVNGTFDELLALRGAAREVVLLGPSSPLYPEPFFQRGITAVMGTRIFDPFNMLTIVSEAGGTKKLQRHCGEKIAFRKMNKESA